MAQFDIVANPDRTTAARAPYLIILQHDLLSRLPTVIVAPLVKENFAPVEHFHPQVWVDGEIYRLSTAELFATRRNRLGHPVASGARSRDDIIRATDLLFSGI